MIAYLESGGFVFPLIVSTLVGISVAVKVYWGKIIGLFRKDKEDEE